MSLLAQMGMMMGKAGGEKPPAYDEWTIHSNGEPQTSLIQSFGSIPDGYAVICFAYKSDLKPTFTIELNDNPLEVHDTHEVDAQIGAVVAYTDAQFSDSDPNILDIQSDEPFFNVYGRLLPIDYLPEEVWRASDNGTGSSAVLGTELADIFGAVAIDDIQERKPETTPIATHYWGVGKTGTDIPLDVPVIPSGSAWSYSSGEYSRIDQGAMSETLELPFSVPTAGEVAINLDYRPSTNAELYIELVDSTLAKTKRLVMAVGNSQLLMGNPTKTYTRLNLIGKGELAVSVATQEPDETTVGGVQRGEDEQIRLLQASPNYFSFAAVGLTQGASYDPDAQAIIDRMIPEPDTALKERLNAFVVALKNPALWGVEGAAWGRISTLGVSATAQNMGDSLLDWKRPVSYVPYGSTTWSAEKGWIGANSAAQYIDTLWIPDGDSNFGITDACLFAFVTDTASAGSTYYIAHSSNASYANQSAILGTTSTIQGGINTTNNAIRSVLPANGLIFAVRDGTQTRVFVDGNVGETVRTDTATGRSLRSIKLFVRDNNGSFNNPFSGSIGMFGSGASFTAAEQVTLKALYDAYVSAA